MAQYNFGVGTIIGKRTDLANTPPAFLGVIQDIQISMDQTLKELRGQFKLPVDVAPAELKIVGTAKFARIQASTINNLLLGQTATSAAGIDLAAAELGTIPGLTPFTVTVANAATFLEDFGVFYHATGQQLSPVASGPVAGQYIAGAAGVGTYTFAAADAGLQVDIYYSFSVTTLKQILAANQLMGVGPLFELIASQNYAVQGVNKKLNLKLNSCRASKLTFPFKNVDYTIMDFDFTAYADASGNWGTWALSE